MKLYDLVTFRKRLLEAFNIDNSVAELSKVRDHLQHLDRDLDPRYSEVIQSYIQTFNESIIAIQHQQGSVSELLAKIDQNIVDISHELFSEGYDSDLRNSMMNHTMRLQREFAIPEAARYLAIDRIRTYCDWHYPGLELGCRNGSWTQYLVGCDPLYIADLDQSFLNITAGQFNELYQSRLRPYVIKFLPHTNEPNLNILPENQFGFVFSWEFFNYLALETTRYYLEQIFKLLRPGGSMMFSYNDGDTPNGAAYAPYSQSYMPKSHLVRICNQIGYQIINSECYDNGVVNWLEIRKPGELSTIKSHQALGEIIRIQY